MDTEEFKLKAELDEAIAISNKPIECFISIIACKPTPLIEDHESCRESGYIGSITSIDNWEAWVPSNCPRNWNHNFIAAHKDIGMIEYVMQQFEAKESMS